MSVAVVIPFRDRGVDLRRAANLEVVQAWWYAHGYEPQIVDDDLTGDAQFNRHRAYNRAVEANPEADVFVFTEADMLIPPDQIRRAVDLAETVPGLVVPFTQYRYWSDETTDMVREAYSANSTEDVAEWWSLDTGAEDSVFLIPAESTMENGRSIGAVNVLSRRALDMTGGFTEATSGNWYDDNIINEAFAYLTKSRTRYIAGPAIHLYHLPGHAVDADSDSHLTEADRQATEKNKRILRDMRRDILTRQQGRVHDLMRHREED